MYSSFKKTALVITMIGLAAACAVAQDVSFEASVNTNKMNLGTTAQLTLTVNGSQKASVPELPAIDGFEARYLGPSTRISIMNGAYHSSVGYTYTLFPLKVGKFQIPAITVTIEGQSYSSTPIDMEVVDAQTPIPPGGSQAGDQAMGTSAGLEDKIFITMSSPKKEVYVNEKVPVTVKLFVTGLSVRDLEFPEFDHDGFTVDPIATPNQYQQVVGGVQYGVVEFSTYVYPLRTGPLNLGPARVHCNLLYENSRNRQLPSAGFGGAFDDDFFNNFFQNYERRPVTISSTDLPLTVLSLPEEGKPANFSGAVGQFDFEVTATPNEVAVGDPVTLKMKISGNGNLKAANFPTFGSLDGFKFYDPQIKELDNTKLLEQVMIPKLEEVKEIPVVSFTYFNPDTQSYQTIPRGPFPLKVTKSEQKEDFKMVGMPQASGAPGAPENLLPETIGRDIVFIKEQPGVLYPKGTYLHQNPTFISIILFYIIGWAGLYGYYRYARRIKSDVVYARRLQAPRKAKKGLEEAGRFLGQSQTKEFYNALFRTLQEYLGDKFHLSSAGITFSGIEGVLKSKGINGEVIGNIKSVFDDCDLVRYADMGQDKEKMGLNYDRAQKIIDHLERHK